MTLLPFPLDAPQVRWSGNARKQGAIPNPAIDKLPCVVRLGAARCRKARTTRHFRHHSLSTNAGVNPASQVQAVMRTPGRINIPITSPWRADAPPSAAEVASRSFRGAGTRGGSSPQGGAPAPAPAPTPAPAAAPETALAHPATALEGAASPAADAEGGAGPMEESGSQGGGRGAGDFAGGKSEDEAAEAEVEALTPEGKRRRLLPHDGDGDGEGNGGEETVAGFSGAGAPVTTTTATSDAAGEGQTIAPVDASASASTSAVADAAAEAGGTGAGTGAGAGAGPGSGPGSGASAGNTVPGASSGGGSVNPGIRALQSIPGWSFPATRIERIRLSVFVDLSKRGYYLSTGAKFGSDFLAYPGALRVAHA